MLTFEVTEAALFAIQVAPATTAGVVLDERVEITNDRDIAPASVVEIVADHGGRVHLVSAPPGVMSFAYAAELVPHAGAPSAPNGDFVASMDAVMALRQSRYCPSDVLAGYATTEFFDALGDDPDAIALRRRIVGLRTLARIPQAAAARSTRRSTRCFQVPVCVAISHT